MSTVRLALAQLNMTVGDIEGNCLLIEATLNDARSLGADIVAFPEMAITGYPPEDLLLKPDFIQTTMEALDSLQSATKGLIAIIGMPLADGDLFNAAMVIQNGELAGIYRKQHLPNYSVFDEERYFQSGVAVPVFTLGDLRIGVSICEDIWFHDGPHKAQALRGGAQLLINISASPYRINYGLEREQMIAKLAADNRAFVAYCNLVGGQDELVFDGYSLICDPNGEIIARGPQFEEALIVVDLDTEHVKQVRSPDTRFGKVVRRSKGSNELLEIELAPTGEKPDKSQVTPTIATPLKRLAEVYNALVLGTRDYVRKNGFEKVVLGLSGGVDSSLTAAIAAKAVGPQNVIGISMPSRYSSEHSLSDAVELADNLGIDYRLISIDSTFQAYLDMLSETFKGLEQDTTEENIQARIRGSLLMALSNKFGWLVLTTGNKSEVAVGYYTLYGDSAGGFSIIKDVPKTLVYEFGQYINEEAGQSIIPDNVLAKDPSAELRPDQRDSDSLPVYEILDPILHAYVEECLTPEEIVGRGFKPEDVDHIIHLIDTSEYKRRQSPPGIKIMPRAFGKDWRLPITNAYKRRT